MTGGSPSSGNRLLGPRLQRADDELLARFTSLSSTADVADLLEIDEKQLTFILWRSRPGGRYSLFQIGKRRGGVREISAPNRSIKILQKKLSRVLKLVAKVRSSVHGFQCGRSIVTNAMQHLKQRWVLNVDLRDFFPSINFGRVRGLFMAKPYQVGERGATALAQLCCHEKRLPQGAPTSPVISNMVCAKLDGELKRISHQYGCRYTRYADDLTFSTSRSEFPSQLATLTGNGPSATAGSVLVETIEAINGFQINHQKVRLQHRDRRQEVTGLVVNRRPNVRRRYTAQIRAMLHAWEAHGYDAAESEFRRKHDTKHRVFPTENRLFEHVIRGRLAFLYQVRGPSDARYRQLRRWLAHLAGEAIEVEVESMDSYEYDVFICHASEDKATVATPLAQALQNDRIQVWIDAGQIRWGDGITQKINEGLSKSRFVILTLSESFLRKNWPQKEMNAVMAREIKSGVTCALPLLVGGAGVRDMIFKTYPLLVDKQYAEWTPGDVGNIVSKVKGLLL